MDATTIDISKALMALFNSSPIFGLLGYAVWKLWNKVGEKDTLIQKLMDAFEIARQADAKMMIELHERSITSDLNLTQAITSLKECSTTQHEELKSLVRDATRVQRAATNGNRPKPTSTTT